MPPNFLSLIPLDKSWHIRMGVLDLINGKTDTIKFLRKQSDLGDDLSALLHASEAWPVNTEINVGESGTLYRYLQFTSWKLGLDKKFVKEGTLSDRPICDNPEIVNWTQYQLLTLDRGTSQWASAAVLLGDKERLIDAPFKLKLTYEAINHWNNRRAKNECWETRYDQTIEKQAKVFIEMLAGKPPKFVPEQAEDYCFARAFDFISSEEGERRWPALRAHESDRILEIEKTLDEAASEKSVSSRDHRVIQAVAMLLKLRGKEISFLYPECVSKSWPQFWKFLELAKD